MPHSTEAMLRELDAMSSHLQDYLLGNDLFKTITVHSSSGDRLIKMTLGGMLERLEELGAQVETSPILRQAQDALALGRRQTPDRFYQMLAREAKSYTDSWNWFLQSCWEGERRCRTDYATEVPIRLRLERLLAEGEGHPALDEVRARTRALDERLRALWQAEDEPLLGDPSQYPRERYWWLYGQPDPSPAV